MTKTIILQRTFFTIKIKYVLIIFHFVFPNKVRLVWVGFRVSNRIFCFVFARTTAIEKHTVSMATLYNPIRGYLLHEGEKQSLEVGFKGTVHL